MEDTKKDLDSAANTDQAHEIAPLNQSEHTTGTSDPQDTEQVVDERDAYRDQLYDEARQAHGKPKDRNAVEMRDGDIEFEIAQRFDHRIDERLFSRLLEASRSLRGNDPRLSQIGAQALIAAGCPLRKADNGLFGFDGLRWRTDGVEQVFSAWWTDAYDAITEQTSAPVWWRFVLNPDDRTGADPMKGAHWEVHGARPTAEQRSIARSAPYAMDIPFMGRLRVSAFSYHGERWSAPMAELFRHWKESPHGAMAAVAKALPKEDAMIEDPVEHLSTPHGLLVFRRDGDIGRYRNSSVARRLGITHMTAPLPELPTDVDLAELDWREFAPTYAEALDRALDPDVGDYFWRLVGYTLYGRPVEKIVALAFGPADSLKSTLLVPVASAIGSYAKTVKQERMLKAGSVRDTLIDLRGLRMVLVPMREMLSMADVGRLHELSSGVPMAGGWTSQAVIWAEASSLPRVVDIRPLERRLRVFPFTNQLAEGEIDRWRLTHILENELPGVLLFALQGVQQYLARGLDDVPLAISEATMLTLLAGGDVLDGFMRLLTPSSNPMPFATLYDALKRLCALVHRTAPGKNVLSTALTDRGYAIKKRHGGTRYVYAQLGLSEHLGLTAGNTLHLLTEPQG